MTDNKNVAKLIIYFYFVLVAKRRLAFMNKEGYDRFGKNKLFAPLMKWEAFKKHVEAIRDRAKAYEDAYNAIKASIERQDGINTIVKVLPQATRLQVVKQKERLIEARRIAISEKGAYVLVGVFLRIPEISENN